ncbi:amino acid adenylation domain-containing protein [Lentzea sp. BCCO 10_0061]|uniref:Phenyloxazoline synthase MbtB n=1 Tax=Lentzea sokolovensis TaxID=3095429 RepID=A0ABU4VF38_9PSEU|nr:amino acid adenylation domain-containing protein [Lentzea sp. BCCO 10_0061]MDX8149495.1 amino acid adenylation domain-containing protein [Lentzea sp. BCCO 10_0061]
MSVDQETGQTTAATLAGIWCDLLQVRSVADGDDFYELGGTSLTAIALVHRVESAFGEGVLTIDALDRNPGFASMADAVGEVLARGVDREAGEVSAPIDPSAPFALTPTQQAYWIGRGDDQPLGGVGSHVYFEFDAVDVDRDAFDRAVRTLVARHGMLRARFLPGGRQQIADESPWRLVVHDLSGLDESAVRAALAEIRSSLSHRRLEVERGEVFDIRLTVAGDGFTRIHFSFDLLVADGRSVQVVLDELSRLYADPSVALPLLDYDFAQYLADWDVRAKASRAADRAYWHGILAELPGAPALPLATSPEHIRKPRFVRSAHTVPAAEWQRFLAQAQAHGVTAAMALAAAYAEVLGRWSGEPRFLLNMPHFGRRVTHPAVPDMVGDFSDIVLLPVDLSTGSAFGERARALQSCQRENMAHSDYYGVEVLRDLARQSGSYGNPAPIVFSYNVFDAFGRDMVGDQFRRHFGELGFMITQTPQVWLDHQVYYRDDDVVLVWDAVDGLFEAGVVDDMFAAYVALLNELASDEGAWSRPVEITVPPHQQEARRAVHTTTPPSDVLLHQRFFRIAEEEPSRIALYQRNGGVVSYGELADSALRVAASLTSLGAVPSDVVAVMMPKGGNEIAAVMGVLAAGAAYLPIGADVPAERRRHILERAGARFALVPDGEPVPGWEGSAEVLTTSEATRAEPLPGPVPQSADAIAYLIFTSGSTGTPKGVEVTHRAAVNTIDWVNSRYGVGVDDRVLALTALDFDLSVYDNFGPLSRGGALVLVGEDQRRDVDAWWELIERHEITIWNSVPSLMDALLSARPGRRLPASLRLAVLSGDWIPLDLPGRLADAGGGKCRLAAMGGPTETAIWSNVFDGQAGDGWTSVPYGYPLSNQVHRVVDERGRDCPDWLPGELWVGGVCLARGYRDDPGQTAERFVADRGTRWYRTGDLVRYRPGGVLEMLGRTDFQVKVNGVRVELGEIDDVLRRHPGVRRGVTVAAGARTPQLVSFVVPTGTTVNLDDLRSFSSARLSSAAVPARVYVVDELPVTQNGKVDRRTLTEWVSDIAEISSTTDEPPRPGQEEAIAQQWELVLGAPVVSRSDNFFTLGGNSLLATSLVKSLRDSLGARISLRDLYSAPTVAAMAGLVAENGGSR